MDPERMSKVTAAEAGSRPDQLRRVALASAVGTTIEWYDYFIYSTAAALVFGSQFFTTLEPASATLASFATLGVGFLARPVGGILWGHFGDRVGRKAMLIASLLLMGTPRSAWACCPPTIRSACSHRSCFSCCGCCKGSARAASGAAPL